MITIPNLTIHHTWQGVPPGVKRVRDIPFKQVGDRRLLLDIFLPEDATEPLPVVIWVCGGGWTGMSKNGVEQVSGWLAGRGFAVVGFEYRLSHQALFPACAEDCKAAVRWVRAEGPRYHLDPARIGVWGDSAGGHLAAMLAASAHVKELEREGPHLEQSSAVQAACVFYPITDLVALADAQMVQDLLGGPLTPGRRVAYELASPLTHVTPSAPPHLIVHGDADAIVPFDQGVRYHEALQRAGVETTLLHLPGVGHSGRHLYGAEEVKQHVADFFARHLLGHASQ